MIKQQLESLVQAALKKLAQEQQWDISAAAISVERSKDARHGDFACHSALALAKRLGINPRTLAADILAVLPASELLNQVEVAGPGFINFFVQDQAFAQLIPVVLKEGSAYGRCDVGRGEKLHIEIISANPTGPLHVGHGRLAAYGATVANLLEAVGYRVHREYYINDAGRQMRILAVSVWLRYLELLGERFNFPENGYKGIYIIDISRELQTEVGERLRRPVNEVFADLPTEDPEIYMDRLVERVQNLLGEAEFERVHQFGLKSILDDICNDLEEFGVSHQEWYPESQLARTGAFREVIAELQTKGCTYEKDGALWFAAAQFGDEKDRVVLRENGQPTYFAADIAYHLTKFERGFSKIVDIFGADHHGYVARMRAFLQAIGKPVDAFNVLLVQFAILYRGQEKVSMSTRGGSFVTLRELREEVGNDAARFFYVMRKREQHLDFDLELAKSRSQENPVYYIQYAHARICSVFRQLEHKKQNWEQTEGLTHLQRLDSSREQTLLREISRYPEIIAASGIHYEPHVLANYLQELAQALHTYYNAEQFLVEDQALRNARLCLIAAVRQILANGLQLLGVSAPSAM